MTIQFARELGAAQIEAEAEELLDLPAGSLRGRSLAEVGRSSFDAAELVVMLHRRYGLVARTTDLLHTKDLAGCLQTLHRDQAAQGDGDRFAAGDRVPLSWQQRGVWFGCLLEPDSTRYHFHAILSFGEPPEADALRARLAAALRQSPTMRIRLHVERGLAWQLVPPAELAPGESALTEVQLSTLPASPEDLVAKADGNRPFDLHAGPLVRWTLVHLPDGSAALLHTEHHLVHDGLSFKTFLRHLENAPQSPPDYRYFSYATAQLQPTETELQAVAELCSAADLAKFAGTAQGSDLFLRFRIPARLLESATAAARDAGVSLFTVLFAAFSHAIGEHQGRDRFIVGTGVGNRPSGHDESIGMYVSLTPVLARRDSANRPGEQLRQIHDALTDGINRAHLPMQDIVRALGPAVRGRNSLFCAAFSMDEHPKEAFRIAGRTAVLRVGIFNGSAKQPVDALVVRYHDRAELLIEADGQAVGADDLWSVWTHMVRWLQRLGDDHDATVGTGLRWQLPAKVAKHAETRGNAVALRDQHREVTYRDLVTIGSARRADLGHGHRVGILGRPGAAFFAVAYAVLAGGGTYIPLDADQPVRRLEQMVRQSECDAFVDLTDDEHLAAAVFNGEPALSWQDLTRGPSGTLAPASSPAPAYTVFTSGSTGTPKGVVISRAALDNLCEWLAATFELSPGVQVGQWASVGFDGSVVDVWPALWAGSTVSVVPRELRADPLALADWLVAERIERIGVGSGIARLLVSIDWPAGSSLGILVSGGDRLEPIPDGLPFRVLNTYGPTECTGVTTAVWVEPEAVPPIGRPAPYGYVRVVQASGAETGPETAGELWIGGAGVGNGYLGDDAATAARFVPDPHSPDGALVYRTGDIVRQRQDGTLEFLGRKDRQIKVVGVRFELAELEAIARAQDGCERSIAGVRDGRPHIFVVPAHGVDTKVLASQIRADLPAQIRHIAIHFIEKFPVTGNGKIDLSGLLS